MAKDRERHARILCRIWDDPDWKARSPRAQWFYMLLISQASINRAGVIALTSKRWTRLASGPAVEQQIALAMAELEAERFIVVDLETEELLVRSYMRGDGVEKQPNVLKAACRQATEVLSPDIRAVLEAEMGRLESPSNVEAKSVLEATIEALAKGSGNPSPNPSPDGPANGSPKGMGKPRGVGVGERSSSHLDNSGSSSSTSEIASRPSDSPRSDVESLCSRLLERMRANGSKGSITRRWRTEARLLLDRDLRPFDEAARLIDWATGHEFWSANILSMPTFRAKYDQLRLQASRQANGAGGNSTDANIRAILHPNGSVPALRALPGGAS